jgi:hypothetical protein
MLCLLANILTVDEQVDTMANFIVRLKILLADPKVDTGSFCIEERLVPLFRKLGARWQRFVIRPVYFEKVVSMCKEYSLADKIGKTSNSGRANSAKKKSPKNSKSGAGSGSGGQKGDESKQISAALLSACLDIFIVLSEVAPSNGFLWDNSLQVKEVVGACFCFARNREEAQVRESLGKLIVGLTSLSRGKRVDCSLAQFACVLLENCLVDGEIEYSKIVHSTPSSPDTHRHPGTRPPSGEGEETEDAIATFALDVIKGVNNVHPSFFERFSSALLALLNTLVKLQRSKSKGGYHLFHNLGLTAFDRCITRLSPEY